MADHTEILERVDDELKRALVALGDDLSSETNKFASAIGLLRIQVGIVRDGMKTTSGEGNG